jgi:hypothetical protein
MESGSKEARFFDCRKLTLWVIVNAERTVHNGVRRSK